jgi:hypothetical protein
MNLCDFLLERDVSIHELANLIDVSDDEVYSKIRGTSPWYLPEVVTICNHFKTVDIGLFGVQFYSNT